MQFTKTTIIITTAILILTLLTAGCTDTGGANPETPKYTAQPEEIAVVEETVAVVEDIPEPVETPWYASMKNAEVGTYSTMFGKDVCGVKNTASSGSSYNIYDLESSERVLIHQEWNPSLLRLDLKLSSDQYRTLNAQYGSMISVTMETIDLDQDGAMDKVAVKYVGTKGEYTVAIFACTVDTSNNNSNETDWFDMCFKALPTRYSCDDVSGYGPSGLIGIYFIPNDERVLSYYERLY